MSVCNQSESVKNPNSSQESENQLDYNPVPADRTKYTILQVNGCRSNRALDWTDPEPSTNCELYVKNIPRRFKGEDLWPLFERFGRIFNIRVLMDYNDFNRGFAYVKFSQESEALIAMELMNHFFLFPGYRLNVLRSTSKRRLFANFIPKMIPVTVVQEKFREIFPAMRELVMPPIGGRVHEEGALHRGIAFVDFRTHEDAVAAKKTINTGVLEVWGTRIKFSWARLQDTVNDTEEDRTDFYPRLFIKPFVVGTPAQVFVDFVGEKVQALDKVVRFDLKKTVGIMKVLSTRAGEEIMQKLNGQVFCGQKMKISWYRERNTMERRYCYCKTLQVMCMANYWTRPVILFGRIFVEECEQYAALFTTFRNNVFTMFVKMRLNDTMDMTSRVSEVFLALIEDTGYLPSYNYVVEVEENTARVVGFVDASMGFIRTYKSGDASSEFFWEEMMELNWAVQKLARINPKFVYKLYHDAIDFKEESVEDHDQFLVPQLATNNRVFSSVYNDQTDMILFVLCDKMTKSNRFYSGQPPALYSTTQSRVCHGKHPQQFGLSALDWVKKEREN